MVISILAIVASLAIGAIAIAVYLFKSEDASLSGGDGPGLWPYVLGVGASLILAFLSLGISQIEAGHVGVVRSFGKVHDQELGPGLYYVFPLLNNVQSVDTRVKSLRFEGYTAASLEQQDLFLNATLNYHVDGTKASDIVQQIGLDFEEKIIKPRFLDIPKSVTDDYRTAVVLNSRDEIRTKSIALLSAALEPYGIIVDNISLENFSYSTEYNAAIEQRAVAEQQVQRERQVLEQRRIQAEQAVVAAQGEADAAVARAEGEAEGNRLLTESLSEILVQYAAIQKLNDNINVVLLPSDNGFILNLENLNEPNE